MDGYVVMRGRERKMGGDITKAATFQSRGRPNGPSSIFGVRLSGQRAAATAPKRIAKDLRRIGQVIIAVRATGGRSAGSARAVRAATAARRRLHAYGAIKIRVASSAGKQR
jgi:hypothetical protein